MLANGAAPRANGLASDWLFGAWRGAGRDAGGAGLFGGENDTVINPMDYYYRRVAAILLVLVIAMLMASIGVGMFFRSQ